MDHLWSPWRMKYLRGEEEMSKPVGQSGASATGLLKQSSETACIFCDLPSENRDVENLIIHRGQHVFVILNRYPYNNGHLMVVPFAHTPSLEQLDLATLTELMLLVNQGLGALRAAYKPQAFNLGANIGAAAGAGIAEHVHMHVVPRWDGDTNFLTVLGGTRTIPEELGATREKLAAAFARRS